MTWMACKEDGHGGRSHSIMSSIFTAIIESLMMACEALDRRLDSMALELSTDGRPD